MSAKCTITLVATPVAITLPPLRTGTDLPPIGPESKKANGSFSRKIVTGESAVNSKIIPSRGTPPKTLRNKVDFVSALSTTGLADAIDVTDGSRGIPLMPPGDFVSVLREQVGWTSGSNDALEFIAHFTGRDLNVMGVQSRLIGYFARRIHNVLFITGDPPKMSPSYPRSTATSTPELTSAGNHWVDNKTRAPTSPSASGSNPRPSTTHGNSNV